MITPTGGRWTRSRPRGHERRYGDRAESAPGGLTKSMIDPVRTSENLRGPEAWVRLLLARRSDIDLSPIPSIVEPRSPVIGATANLGGFGQSECPGKTCPFLLQH